MAKIDWNYFEFNGPPEGESAFKGIKKSDYPAEVAPGGSSIALRCEHGPWSGATERPIFGYMYNGPDIGEFPIQDIIMSAAIRTQVATAQCVGMIVRSQVNLSGIITDPNDLNFYMIGVYLDSTYQDNNGSVGFVRVVNGVPTLISSTSSYGVVDTATDYIQVEYKVVDNSTSVYAWGRWNAGSQLTNPGDPGWNGNTLKVDSTPGILQSPGYCGFAVMQGLAGSSSGYYHFDRIRITQELIW